MTLGFVTFLVRGEDVQAFILLGMDVLHTIIVTFALLVGAFRDGDGRLVCYPGQKLKS